MLPTLGSDPELVATSITPQVLHQYALSTDLLGYPVPAYFALDVKDAEHPTIALPHGTLTPDGMAIEFTLDPTNDVTRMVSNLRDNLRATHDLITARGMKLGVDPHFHTDPKFIAALPESFGKACSLQILGCAPDYSAYHLDSCERPDPRIYPWRTSGGHIHVEVGNDILADEAGLGYLVAAFDSVLGTAGTFLCQSPAAYRRKELYGWAGMIRTNPDRGTVEYRTLPAQALVQTEQLARMMFTAAQSVAAHVLDVFTSEKQPDAIRYFAEKIGSYGDIVGTIVPAINAHDVDACRRIQTTIGDGLSGCSTINTVINELQSYTMPDTFDLLWEL